MQIDPLHSYLDDLFIYSKLNRSTKRLRLPLVMFIYTRVFVLDCNNVAVSLGE